MTKKVPDSLLESVAVIAKPADLGAALARRYKGVLQRVSLYFPIGEDDPDERWSSFVKSFRAA